MRKLKIEMDFFFSPYVAERFQWMVAILLVVCSVLAILLAMEMCGAVTYGYVGQLIVGILYGAVGVVSNLNIALIYGPPCWPFYLSGAGWVVSCGLTCWRPSLWPFYERACVLLLPMSLSVGYLVARYIHRNDSAEED